MTTVIIGAGLAGLSAAYHLKDGYEIFEREERVGGLCRSEKIDGFTFDYAIHILYSSNPYASKLIKILLGDNFQSLPRSSWVYSKGVYTHYPFQANTYGLPIEVVKECILGLIKAKYEGDKNRGPKNFEDWCIKTFGEGIARHFMIPFNKKVWSVDPKEMSFDWIQDRVPQPAIEEVVEGALCVQTKGFGPNAQFWYPRKGGIEELPKGFLFLLDKERIRLKSKVTGISIKKKLIYLDDGKKREYNNLISTIPLPQLIKMIVDTIPPEIKNAVNLLRSNSLLAVNLGIDRENISDKHWIYFPEDFYIFQRLSFPMNFSENMAPQGKSSITAEISVVDLQKIDKEALMDMVISDLLLCGIIRDKAEVIFRNIFVLSPAYIIYDHSRKNAVDCIKDFLKEYYIYSCGRFGDWEYLNMDHSILSGKRVADEILQKQ